jgi:ABC-type transport system substrate-binding protein
MERYAVKFVLKEPFVWMVDTLALPSGMWIIAPKVVQQFSDLKQLKNAIGTGPFLLRLR